MIDNIWSGWRSGYLSSIDRVRGSSTPAQEEVRSSIFSDILNSGSSDAETFIVHRGRTVFTIMNSFPYAVGHVLVLPYRQVAELENLSTEETAELWSEVETAVRVLRSTLAPDGFNVGLNLGPAAGGSVSEHLHVHVVPRWFGDANFTVTTASVKAIPEALDVTASKIRAEWSAMRTDENGAGTVERRSANKRENRS
jgi:ATP adenylyltransferase